MESECKDLDIGFHLLSGVAADVLPGFVKRYNVNCLVTDTNPLRMARQWLAQVDSALPRHVKLAQVMVALLRSND